MAFNWHKLSKLAVNEGVVVVLGSLTWAFSGACPGIAVSQLKTAEN
jgi:hypothetical protein